MLPISKLAGIMADTLRKMGMGSSDSGRAVLDHTGTITVRGVSDSGQAMDVAEIAVEAVLDKMRREGRAY